MKYLAMALAVLTGAVWLGHNRRPGIYVKNRASFMTNRLVDWLPLRYDDPFALAQPHLELFRLIEEDYPPEQWPPQTAT